MNSAFWQKMQEVNTSVIYAILIALVMASLLIPHLKFPNVVSPSTRSAYNVIEAIGKQPHPKLVIVDGWWDSGTYGENYWQAKAVFRQLLKDHIPFAIMSGTPQNTELSQQIVSGLAPQYGSVYGRDYINWGYRNAYGQILKALVHDIPGTMKEDYLHRHLKQFPIMQDVHTMRDVSAIVEITASSSVEVWMQFVQGVYQTPLLLFCTAVEAPTYFPYVDSGQMSGLVMGVKGAGDYEQLLGVSDFGTKVSTALSLVYSMIIILMIIGNVGYFMTRREAKRARSGQNE